jgi:integrase
MNNIDPEKLLELLDETEKALEHLLAGLRVSEVAALRWRAVNLARATIEVESGKTDAASRVVDMSPSLRDEVASHKARSRPTDPDELVFPTRNGTVQHRANISNRVLAPAIRRANERLVMEGRPPIQEGVTNHTLRRTFCALLFEAGASPAYAMQQMGGTSPRSCRSRSTARSCNAHVTRARRSTHSSAALIGHKRAQTAPTPKSCLPVLKQKPRRSGAFRSCGARTRTLTT